jgi:hypothetical protein
MPFMESFENEGIHEGEGANLDRRLRLYAGGYHQNRFGAQCLALHFSTDFIGSVPLAQAPFDGQPVSPVSAPN